MFNRNLVALYHVPKSREWFKQSLEALGKFHRFGSVGEIDDYYYKGEKKSKLCHITFDDGHKNVYEHAFPVLKEMGIPATLFVSPKIIEEGTNFWFQNLQHQSEIKIKDVLRPYFSEAVWEKIKDVPVYELLKSIDSKHLAGIEEALLNPKRPENQNVSVENLLEMQDSGIFTIGSHTGITLFFRVWMTHLLKGIFVNRRANLNKC